MPTVPILDTVLDVAGSVLDRVIPDPHAKREAKRKLAELAQAGELERERQAIERLRIAADDRGSARAREQVVKDWTPRILAFCTFFGFFLVLGALLFLEVPEASRQAFLILLGSLQTILAGVVGYYFGSSEGSKQKQATLDQLMRVGEHSTPRPTRLDGGWAVPLAREGDSQKGAGPGQVVLPLAREGDSQKGAGPGQVVLPLAREGDRQKAAGLGRVVLPLDLVPPPIGPVSPTTDRAPASPSDERTPDEDL